MINPGIDDISVGMVGVQWAQEGFGVCRGRSTLQRGVTVAPGQGQLGIGHLLAEIGYVVSKTSQSVVIVWVRLVLLSLESSISETHEIIFLSHVLAQKHKYSRTN
jgi:hypothetical protein